MFLIKTGVKKLTTIRGSIYIPIMHAYKRNIQKTNNHSFSIQFKLLGQQGYIYCSQIDRFHNFHIS